MKRSRQHLRSIKFEGDLFARLLSRLRSAAPDGIEFHGLAPMAADLLGPSAPRRLRASTLPGLVAASQAARLLPEIRAIVPGRLVLIKGPEVAARYPAPHHRPFLDLDLLSDQPERAYPALMAAGWSPAHDAESFAHTHQFPALVRGPDSLAVEIHRCLAWPAFTRAPATAELLVRAVPSRLGVEGLEALHPAHHTLQLAAHGWLHRPFRSLRDLLDVELCRRECSAPEIESAARAWGLRALWCATARAADYLFGHRDRCPWQLALLGRHVLGLHPSTRRAEIVAKALGRFAVTRPDRAVGSVWRELSIKMRRDEVLKRRLPRALIGS